MKKNLILISLLLFILKINNLFSQEDLFNLISKNDSIKPETQYAVGTFKTTRIINGQSVETPPDGCLIFIISHHFGTLNQGPYEFWGLDQATDRFGFEYSFTKRLCLGVGRSSYEKTFDGFIKFILLKQCSGKKNIPLSIDLYADMTYNSLKNPIPQVPSGEYKFNSRLAYVYEFLIARKFNENLSLQLTPAFIHKNLVPQSSDRNDLYSIGLGGRYKLTHRLSFNVEYFYLVPNKISGNYNNSLSIGFDIETGGHVFQIHLTNSLPMFDRGFITETNGTWAKGNIHPGFNINRTFTLHKSSKSQRWE